MSMIDDYPVDKIKRLSKQIDRFIDEHPNERNWVPNFTVPSILLYFNSQSDDDTEYRQALEFSSKLLFLTDSDFNSIIIMLEYLKEKYNISREDLMIIFSLHSYILASNNVEEPDPQQIKS